MRFVYYGGSVEFFFSIFLVFIIVTIIGMFRNNFLWGIVRGLEGFANMTGRLFAWAGLLMVLQQILIVFMQRIFTRPDISIGFGIPLQFDISWFAEELKLYNALVVCLCVTYAFVQGSHVRVDLVYSAVKFRTKKVIDMFGSLMFMMPMAVLTWLYGWYFLWRHLIVPNPSASDQLDRLLAKSRALRWNVETIGFSPNGFTGYFLFKILLVPFAGLVFIHAIAFFYRSFLEWKEGEESEGKYLDRDTLGEGEEAYEGTH
jgi:TRAP-type mannitol/chloroaromatic compound transport system permease small subunit